MLELADDLGADWTLDLWEAVPTPEKAARAREKSVARILKSYRIRRFDAAHVISELRKPALSVAQGTREAATAHIRVVIVQLRVVNRQLAERNSSSIGSARSSPNLLVERKERTCRDSGKSIVT